MRDAQYKLIVDSARARGATFPTQAAWLEFKAAIDAAVNDNAALAPVPKPADELDGVSWAEMLRRLTNTNAPAITEADYRRAADELGNGVTPKHMKASKKVEAPRGAFDDAGRPTILFERHVFSRNTAPKGRFNSSHPDLSAVSGYGPGGYGAFSAQYPKLGRAYALDPEAAFEACSWGAFQVLGENAASLGYPSARAMALELAKSEAAHLDSYARFVRENGLAEALGKCRAGNPDSCIPFVSGYNGSGFRRFNYHIKFAEALRGV
jgi:hypothetical protein